MKRLPRPRAAFTLLEIMLVVLIIGLLVGMGAKMMFGRLNEARIVRAQADMQGLKTGLLMYSSSSRGVLPTTGEGLKALVEKPASNPKGWSQRIEPGQLLDPWNHEYNYVHPGIRDPKNYDLFSSGPDGQPNTDDDVGMDSAN